MIGLNTYQKRFVKRLIDAKVSFLVIGGQARHDFDGDYDLDLWVDASDWNNARAAQGVIAKWLVEHPVHCSPGTAEAVSRGIMPDKMISIPDEVCAYLDDDQSIATISRDNGIEVLMGRLEGIATEYMNRAVEREAEPGLVLRSLSREDAMAIPRLAKHASPRPFHVR